MKKIPLALVRDPADRTRVIPVIAMGCEWVFAGEGVPTRKFDGTCIMFDGLDWWARREVKPGKPAPPSFQFVAHDRTTGKTQGWEPVRQSPFYKQWQEAYEQGSASWSPGTYELIGPKINGNPEQWNAHYLIAHGSVVLPDRPGPRDVAEVMAFVQNLASSEGVVWHHPDGRMAKLKRRDIP